MGWPVEEGPTPPKLKTRYFIVIGMGELQYQMPLDPESMHDPHYADEIGRKAAQIIKEKS